MYKTCIKLFLCICLILVSTSFMRQKKKMQSPKLTSIHLVDRNGLSETISNTDRLKQYETVDFLKPAPYQKVLRVYSRDPQGNIRSFVTTYYENGQPKQYLEIVNARAFGTYQEWHPNGTLSLSTNIIGGAADVTISAEKTWLFDGTSYAWNEAGQLIAEICYKSGELEGPSTYYHPNGTIWKKIYYCNNQPEGAFDIYLEDGTLLQQIHYKGGKKNGTAFRFWNAEQIASEETFQEGCLITGRYYDLSGNQVSQIENGQGLRAIFGKSSIHELQEYRDGLQEGEVKVFQKDQLQKTYLVKDGMKHGLEIDYYPSPKSAAQPLPKLSLTWFEGKIQGIVKTWYDNGNLESQREMGNNRKNGTLSAWYRDGSLMLTETYENDKLIKGEYYKKGEKLPVSRVFNGKGTATIYEANGSFVHKITYDLGKPLKE